MKKYQRFIVFWLTDVILLYLSEIIFPDNYELGNSFLASYQAAFFTGLVWSWLIWNVEPQLKKFEIKLEGQLGMIISYLVANFAILWFLARFAVLTGFGVSSYLYVALLALVANIIQYFIWQNLERKND
jgi:hypothetical protein